jgi:hypothetical protein
MGTNGPTILPTTKIFAEVLKVQAESMKKKHHNHSSQN